MGRAVGIFWQIEMPFVHTILYFSRLLLREGESPSTAVANTDISLNDLLMFPGACIDRSTVRLFSIHISPLYREPAMFFLVQDQFHTRLENQY